MSTSLFEFDHVDHNILMDKLVQFDLADFNVFSCLLYGSHLLPSWNIVKFSKVFVLWDLSIAYAKYVTVCQCRFYVDYLQVRRVTNQCSVKSGMLYPCGLSEL